MRGVRKALGGETSIAMHSIQGTATRARPSRGAIAEEEHLVGRKFCDLGSITKQLCSFEQVT